MRRTRGESPYESPPTISVVDAVAPLAQHRLGAQQPILPLPGLQSPDEPDDRHAVGQLDRRAGPHRRAGRRDPAATTKVRRRREQTRLGSGGGVRGSSRSQRGKQRRRAVEPAAPRDRVLPPDDTARHPGEQGGGRAVELRFRRPVEDQVRPAGAQQPRERQDRRKPAVGLAQAPGWASRARAGLPAQLVRPWPVLEEHELELVRSLIGAVQQALQHRLGAAEAVGPTAR